jgi:hypothetical protein
MGLLELVIMFSVVFGTAGIVTSVAALILRKL